MREFKKVNKTFIKSNNSTTKIYNRYLNQILSKYELESFCFSKNDLK